MLKITVVKNGEEHRLIVEGKLTGPCIPALESAWNQVRQTAGSRPVLVDLSAVTLINSKGEDVLRVMVAGGARLAARGLYCEFVVKELMNEARKTHARQSKQNGGAAKDSNSTAESDRVVQCSPEKETK